MKPRLRAACLVPGPALALAFMGAGCSPIQLPTMSPVEVERALTGAITRAPDDPGSAAGFYPLELGNSWHFEGRLTVTTMPDRGPPVVEYDVTRAAATDLTCVESRNGRDYVVERSITVDAGIAYPSYVRMRQDGSGLFEADLDASTPPDCAGDAAITVRGPGTSGDELGGDLTWARLRGLEPGRRARIEAAMREVGHRLQTSGARLPGLTAYGPPGGGVGAGELTRLRYPLRPGQHWIVRDDPNAFFDSWDEGVISLDTDAGHFSAHRVRVATPLMGPNDFVVLFYGRSGFLGVKAHFEIESTDPAGNPTGLVIVEDELKLDGISLAGGPH